MPGQWPLIGRAEELRRMREASSGDLRAVVVAGPPGVGKTRLVHEYLAPIERSGAAVLRVRATRSASQLPLGAFAPFLPAVHHGERPGVDDRLDLLRASASSIVDSAGGRRLVLFADDAHLLDDTSATLVHQLACTGMAFVVATVIAGEPAPDPIVALWRDDAVERLDLVGLQSTSVAELLRVVLGGPVDPAIVHRFADRSQGNVLFLRELVLGALDDQTLHSKFGIWRLSGTLAPSSRLTEIVEIRLRGLDVAERDLLEMLAFGEPLGSAELAVFDVGGAAKRLERRGLVSSRSQGRRMEVRLGHSLYGEVVRANTSALRRREIARLLATAVEQTGARRREDILRIGTWRLEGGGAEAAPMLAAATVARWRYDFPLAERLANAAVQAGAGFDAEFLAAQLAGLLGRADEAEDALALLAAKAQGDRQRSRVACFRLDNHVFHLGHIDTGLEVAEQAEASIEDSAWRDEVVARRSGVIVGQSGPRAGALVAEPVLARAGGRAFVWASLTAEYASARLGRLEDARRTAARGYAAHLALTEPFDWYPWAHLFFTAEALTHEGRFEEAIELAEAQYQTALTENSPEAQGWFAWQLTKSVAERGFPRTAALHGREAVALFRQLGRPLFEQFALGYLATALALSGDPEGATEALAQLDGLDLPRNCYWAADVLQARAWTAATLGDLPRAQALLVSAAAAGEEIGDVVGQASALHCLARLGCAHDAISGLAAIAPQIDGDLVAARAAHVVALDLQDPEGLEAVSVSFEATGAWLLAAEAAADAAVAWRRAQDPRRASRMETRSHSFAARCENPTTPALRVAGESRAQLTRTEREVTLLAMAGHSNKEIAARLGVSFRTVENHLSHVYEKLGISGRDELFEVLSSSDQ